MTSAQSPLRPFPHQGTFSLETGPVENQTGALVLPPTLMLPALSEVRSFATVYLERFAAGTHPGQAVMLRGPHGTGKTHALAYTLSRVSAGRIGPPRNDWNVLQLYAKAEEPDLVGLYRSLMPQLTPATLRRLALRFNAEIAADSLDETLEPGARAGSPRASEGTA